MGRNIKFLGRVSGPRTRESICISWLSPWVFPAQQFLLNPFRQGWAKSVVIINLSLLYGCAGACAAEKAGITGGPEGSPAQYCSGTLRAASDVTAKPDAPISSGLVLAIPAEKIPDLETALSRKPGDRATFPRPLALSAELHRDFAKGTARLKSGGAYELNLPCGTYWLGFANLGESHPDPAAYPMVVYGWTKVELKATKPLKLRNIYNFETRTLKTKMQ